MADLEGVQLYCREAGHEYIQHGTSFLNLKAVLARCLDLGPIERKSVSNKTTAILQDAKSVFDTCTLPNAPGKPRRATLKTIVTKIFPLLVSKYPTLQYYVDIWKDEHDDSAVGFHPGQVLLNPFRLENIPFDAKGLIDPLYLPKWIASQIHGCQIKMMVDVTLLIAIACQTTEENARAKIWPRAPVKGEVVIIGKRSCMSITAFCTDVFPYLAQGKKGAPPAQWRKFMEVHGRGALVKNDLAMETIETSHENIDVIMDESDLAFIADQNVRVTEQIEGEVWIEADKENRDPSGLIYIVTSPLLLAVKIGQWGGTIDELHYRYRTMYGQKLQLAYARVKDRIQAERAMHATFRSQNISNELFERDGWMDYEQYLNCIKE